MMTPPPVSQFVAISWELDSAVRKALAKDPKNRFQTMEELGGVIGHLAAPDLHEVIRQLEGKTKAEAPSRKETTEFSRGDAKPVPGNDLPIAVPGRGFDQASQFGDSSEPAARPSVTLAARSPATRVPMPSARAATSPPVVAISQAGAVQSVSDLILLLRSPDQSVQEDAFTSLCRLSARESGTLHLLFDFMFHLCLWGGLGSEVSKLRLTGEAIKLGRDAIGVNLPLPDPSVSRQHVAFFPSTDAVEVEDLSSANGTFLNGKQCRRERLSDGDSLIVGRREIAIHVLPRDRTVIRYSELVSR